MTQVASVRAADRHRFLALAFVVDGVAGMLAAVAPGESGIDRQGLLSVAVVGLGAAALLGGLGRQLRRRHCEAFLYLGSVLIALGIVAVGTGSGSAVATQTLFGMAYLGAMLYALMWFRLPRAVAQIAVGAGLYLAAALYSGRGGAAVGLVLLQTLGELGIALSMVQFMSGVRRLSATDGATGLTNPEVMRIRAQDALAGGHRHGRQTGLLVVDLDGFGLVNLTHGRAAGDHVLAAVGQRLTGAFPARATVTRLHADVFAVLLADVSDSARLSAAVVAARSALVDPVTLPDGRQLVVTASIGAAVGPRDAEDYPGLLWSADARMAIDKAARKAPATLVLDAALGAVSQAGPVGPIGPLSSR